MFIKTKYYLPLISLYSIFFSGSTIFTTELTNCDCDYFIDSSERIFDANTVKPGEIICIKGGARKELRIDNLNGNKVNPITIKNCEEKVIIESDANYGILITGSNHFKISGTGSEDVYGIYIKKTNLMGVTITGYSSFFEINNVEISNTGFAGIIAKTDPNCQNTDLRSYIMEEIDIHHNFIHDVEGEGIYVGYSWYPTRETDCNGVQTTFYPHSVQGVDIHHYIITRTGWDGLQVGSGTQNILVHHNDISFYGLAARSAQDNGMQIGAGTTGKWYNNKIIEGKGVSGNGIIDIGQGNTTIFNNVIINPKGNGIYVNDKVRLNSSVHYRAFHNTIVNPELHGIHFSMAHTTQTNNSIFNNIIVNPVKDFFSFNANRVHVANNATTTDITEMRFSNPDNMDYSIVDNSPAIDSGKDLSSLGITFDYNDLPRDTETSPFDCGAYEYKAVLTILDFDAPTKVKIYPNPASESIFINTKYLNAKIEIYTINGKQALSKYIESDVEEIDISKLDKGIYLIKTKVMNGNKFVKFVKQ